MSYRKSRRTDREWRQRILSAAEAMIPETSADESEECQHIQTLLRDFARRIIHAERRAPIRPRIGVFPLTASPVTNGHLLSCLAAYCTLELNAVWLLPCGEISHKPVKEHVPEGIRHAMVAALTSAWPILEYCGVSAGRNLWGEDAVQLLRAPGRELIYISGSESIDRVRLISEKLSRSSLSVRSTDNTTLSLAFVVRNTDGAEVAVIKDEFAPVFAAAGIKLLDAVPEPSPLLRRLSSENFRQRKHPWILPFPVLSIVKSNNLYC